MTLKLICLLGPTAVGKTEIAIQLAQRLNAEIVSVDSRQIYRQMDIGTAKPTPEEQRAARHHLIDCVEHFPALLRCRLSIPCRHSDCRHPKQRQDRYYLLAVRDSTFERLLMDCLKDLERILHSENGLKREAAQFGVDALHKRLQTCDPASAERIHPNNLVRVIRALEVYELTGTPMSEFQQQWHPEKQRYPFIAFGLTMPRALLYRRIEQRVDVMLANGLIAEVESLLAVGYTRDSIALQSFGYRELIAYLDGDCTYMEAISQLKQNTRRFAKRQLTWFRKDTRIEWLDRESTPDIVEDILEKIGNI